MAEPIRDEDIEALVRQFQASDLNEMHVKTGGIELFLSKDGSAFAPWAGQSVPPPAAATSAAAAATPIDRAPASPVGPSRVDVDIQEGFQVVRAPYLGTFYRSPKPGEPYFVEIGDSVEAGRDLCLVEVMKLFTAVRAEAGGIVRQVFAVDGQMVEEGQPLFALEALA
jgi:acetyl-CoA carboxylase biotin carboxyl carrier protein